MPSSGGLPDSGIDPESPHCGQILYHLGHQGIPSGQEPCIDRLWESHPPPKPTVFISGVIARGDKDFPPAAAQVAHQKPHASIDRHPSPRTQHIQQPRK
ncbi:hypothetical protein FD755_018646 [Muntiacus reevesi]|uniref:Uncharacterized protein n=1 Tax=Muntiacus reevesi TaxID=9886 RepID=A0A5N3X6A6_MUNRE|nr:hypothetical protein FD755_018646 [Muntiacus reevesi]